jgi:hypothetical protein
LLFNVHAVLFISIKLLIILCLFGFLFLLEEFKLFWSGMEVVDVGDVAVEVVILVVGVS